MTAARLYLRGLLSVRLGDLTETERCIGELKRMTGEAAEYAPFYSRVLTAELLQARGKTREALAALGPPQQLPDRRLPYIWGFGMAEARFLRAQLLQSLGDRHAALQWYATFPDMSAYDIAYMPAARLFEGRLRESMGDREGAALSYLRFLSAWQSADPIFRPIIEETRASYHHLGR
jgi:hypothetical protein